MDQYLKKHVKRFPGGECLSLQDQILHTTPDRNDRLPLVLTRLSDEKTQRTGLLYSKHFLIKERKEQQT